MSALEEERHGPWDPTEDRFRRIETRLDRLLDPETGIYARLDAVSSKLVRWAATTLTAILVAVVVQLVLYHPHH